MDRQRRSLITLGAALLCVTASAVAQPLTSLRELGWLTEEGRIAALTLEPEHDRERLVEIAVAQNQSANPQSEDEVRRKLTIGEALFNAPLLLGGQAAKAGISCQSCHVNGAGNPYFLFPAISGEAGTADTTHNFFSKTLGNDVFDPVAIPDLRLAGKVDHDPQSKELEEFITTIVIEEFSGSTPKQEAIAYLSLYVRALRLAGRTEDVYLPRSAVRDWTFVRVSVEEASHLAMKAEPTLASLVLSSARNKMALIHERLLPEQHDLSRAWLVAQSRRLSELQQMLQEDEFDHAKWQAAFERADQLLKEAPDFAQIEQESLYNPAILTEYLD